MKIPYEKILILTILVLFQNCIKPNNSKFLPLASSSVKPYTQEDLGLTPPPAGSAQASLPMISERESKAIQEALKDAQDLELLTTDKMQLTSIAAKDLVFNRNLNDTELDAKVDLEFNRGRFNSSWEMSQEDLFARESRMADVFYGGIVNNLEKFSLEQLMQFREMNTISLIFLRLQMDYGDKINGLPEEFLFMAREKAIGFRTKINEELIRRDVTHL